MIPALERHEAGGGDPAGQHQAVFEWHACVPHDYAARGLAPSTRGNNSVTSMSPRTCSSRIAAYGRRGDPLQFVEPPHFLMCRVGHNQRREHLPGRGIVVSPAFSNERDRGLCTGHLRRTAALAPAFRETPAQDEARHAFGVADGIGDRYRGALRDAQEREAFEARIRRRPIRGRGRTPRTRHPRHSGRTGSCPTTVRPCSTSSRPKQTPDAGDVGEHPKGKGWLLPRFAPPTVGNDRS